MEMGFQAEMAELQRGSNTMAELQRGSNTTL